MRKPSIPRFAGTIVAMLYAGISWAGDIFDLGVKPADRAVVTIGEALPERWEARSPMLDRLAGVLDDLDKGETLELRKTAMNAPTVDEPANTSRWCVVHLSFGEKSKRVEIVRDVGGTYFAREMGGATTSKPRATRLKQEEFAILASRWSAYRGDWTSKRVPHGVGEVSTLAQPLVPGWLTVDRETLDKRFMGSTHQKIDGAVRDLSQAKFLVRLPMGYSPRTLAGVLVWIDAIDEELPTIYPSLFPAADELGLIIVAATKTGNKVPRGDRYQYALDGLATVAQRCMIDPTRVYVSGESGGGKISTHLWACLPEIVRGAVPIVGLATYTSVPAGPGKVWPQDFIKPNSATMKRVLPHRCAAVTGDRDFNHEPIVQTAKVLTRDGLQVRVFDYPGLSHEVPNAEQFSGAIRWVDEEPREVRTSEKTRGEELLAAYRSLHGGKDVTTDAQRSALVEITRAGPWTPSAWEAAGLLGASAAVK